MGREGSLPLQVEKVVWNVAVCFSLPVKALFQLTWLCRASETQDVLWGYLAKVDTEGTIEASWPLSSLYLLADSRLLRKPRQPSLQTNLVHMERGRLAESIWSSFSTQALPIQLAPFIRKHLEGAPVSSSFVKPSN